MINETNNLPKEKLIAQLHFKIDDVNSLCVCQILGDNVSYLYQVYIHNVIRISNTDTFVKTRETGTFLLHFDF